MSYFTIEQLEALKEGTTPGPWDEDVIYPDCSYIVDDTGGRDAALAFTAPALVDALIAEKRKHDDLRQEIGSLIGKLETRAENAEINRAYTSAVAFRETARDLTRILEATDG